MDLSCNNLVVLMLGVLPFALGRARTSIHCLLFLQILIELKCIIIDTKTQTKQFKCKTLRST